MWKTMGAIVGGIFIGAVAMEIVRMKCPATKDKVYAKVSDVAAGIKEGFLEGYRSTAKPSEPAEVST